MSVNAMKIPAIFHVLIGEVLVIAEFVSLVEFRDGYCFWWYIRCEEIPENCIDHRRQAYLPEEVF